MFSGLTSQVSNWMTKKEEVAKTDDLAAVKDDQEEPGSEKKPISPTKAGGGHMEMLGNVRNQMSSWLGGLRKASDGGAEEENTVPAVSTSPSKDKDDDDNSSATGGADSEVNLTDEEDGKQESANSAAAVSTKALAGAKSLGNFLYSAVNKAGKTVTEAGAKIKKTVGENSILTELNKEQEAFIMEKEARASDTAVPPWVGCLNEEAVKEECLALSTDRKNFIRSPPPGVDFNFNYDVSYPVAMATMAEDTNLQNMRFELVPKFINEEKFWRNYFYRVSLICQANELSSLASASTVEASDEDRAALFSVSAKNSKADENVTTPRVPETHHDDEFVSDRFSFPASQQDIDEVKENIRKMTITSSAEEEGEWQKELDEELQGFEMVNDGNGNDLEWKNQIDNILHSDELSDLK